MCQARLRVRVLDDGMACGVRARVPGVGAGEDRRACVRGRARAWVRVLQLRVRQRVWARGAEREREREQARLRATV